jgi:hypothetical protein
MIVIISPHASASPHASPHASASPPARGKAIFFSFFDNFCHTIIVRQLLSDNSIA